MNNRNTELTILKAIGIISVVSCHLGVNIFNVIGIPISITTELFPEYSYHMPLFIFTSGYFYKRAYENNISELSIKRFSSIVKYLKWNLFYFLLCFILVNIGLLSRDIDFTFESLFIEPFLGGFQFYFNGPGWFVPFLFLLQILFTGTRKVIGIKFNSFRNNHNTNLKQEFIFLISLIVLGFISTATSNIYPVVNENMNIFQSFLRILFGLQFFQLGFLYKEFMEKRIRFSLTSFALLIICKLVFNSIFGSYTFSLRTLKFYDHSILPFIVSILGITYCLHCSRFIMKMSTRISSKFIAALCIIGENTWPIMMHHLLIKWCLSKIYNLDFINDNISLIGSYLISPLLCIILPILFTCLYNSMVSRLKERNYSSTVSSLLYKALK